MVQKKDAKGEKVIIPEAQSVFQGADGVTSMVLDDSYDPNYNPSHEELVDYALWLGMEPDDDEPLMWIAREGLKSPLPEHWRPCKTDSNEIYYFNFQSGDSIWDHPLDSKFKELYKRENTKRQAGKAFKKEIDEEVYEYLHGSDWAKILKKEEANQERKERARREKAGGGKKEKNGKSGESGLPDSLSRALSKAKEKDGVKDTSDSLFNSTSGPSRKGGKFGALPLTPGGNKLGGLGGGSGGLGGGSGGLGGGGGGLSPIDEDKPSMNASALGRQALPGIGGMSREAPGTTRSALGSLKSPLGMKSPIEVDSTAKELGFETSMMSTSARSTAEEDELRKEIEKMREEHKRITEEEKRQHEQMQKRLKFTCEQEIQDLEMELDKQRNNTRRRNATRESEWEREIEEQNLTARRKFERDLLEQFESWKRGKEATQRSKRESIEQEHREALDELESRKATLLGRLEREQAGELEQKRREWERKKEEVESEQAEIDARNSQLESQLRDVEEKERELQDLQAAADREQEALAASRAALEEQKKSMMGASSLSSANKEELETLAQTHRDALSSLENATEEQLARVKQEHDAAIDALRSRHAEEEERAHQELQTKQSTVQRQHKELAQRIESRKGELAEQLRIVQAEKVGLEAKQAQKALESPLTPAAAPDAFEADIAECRRRHEQEKEAMERAFADEKQRMEEQRRELQEELKAEGQKAQKKKEEAARRVAEAAEQAHERAMDEVREALQEEGEAERKKLTEEATQRRAAEAARLRKELEDSLVEMATHTRERIAARKKEESARIQREMTELKLSSERSKQSELEQLRSTGAASAAVDDAKIQQFRAAEQRRLEAELAQLERMAAQKEKTARSQMEAELAGRLKAFEKEQETQLQQACDASKARSNALLDAQDDLSSELRAMRAAHEEKLAALTKEYEAKQAAAREDIQAQHRDQIKRMQAKQTSQIDYLKQTHQDEVRTMESHHTEIIERRKTASTLLTPTMDQRATAADEEGIASLNEAHERAMADAKAESDRALSDEKLRLSKALAELNAAHTVELEAMRKRENAKHQSILKDHIRGHALNPNLSPAASEVSPGLEAVQRARAGGGHASTPKLTKQHSMDKDSVRQAKMFLNSQKRELRKRQQSLEALRSQWESDVAALRRSGGTLESSPLLRKTRDQLNRQAEQLNEEVQTLANREYWLQQRIMKLRQRDEWSEDISDVASTCTSLTPSRPRGTKRGGIGYGGRGGAAHEDPRVLLLLESLTKQVATLTDKLQHLEHDRRSRRGHHSRTHRSGHRRKEPHAYEFAHLLANPHDPPPHMLHTAPTFDRGAKIVQGWQKWLAQAHRDPQPGLGPRFAW